MGKDHASLYDEVTARVIAQLEEGRLPWVQPWESGKAETGLPRNGATGRCYSGINVLILWATLFEKGYAAQRWLTYRQAQALGGNVRRGEQGTTVCYADRFTPKDEQEKARSEDREARQLAFLKRFTVFNVEQCDGLPDDPEDEATEPLGERELIPHAEALIVATGADFRIGGDLAFYSPSQDFIQVPPQQSYGEQINWYRTALHELGHYAAFWIMPHGHEERLGSVTRPCGCSA